MQFNLFLKQAVLAADRLTESLYILYWQILTTNSMQLNQHKHVNTSNIKSNAGLVTSKGIRSANELGLFSSSRVDQSSNYTHPHKTGNIKF